MISTELEKRQEKLKVFNLKSKPKVRTVLLSASKKTARKIKESLDICKIANSFTHRKNIKDLNLHDKNRETAQIVLLDADSYPNDWDNMVRLANELPSVKSGGVVVLSSFGDRDILNKAKMSGALEFIVKPFDLFGFCSLIGKLSGYNLMIVKTGESQQ